MFRYIAGNSLKHALLVSNNLIKINKIPIINYAIENPMSSNLIENEFNNISKNLNWENPRLALKLSLFNFDINLINRVVDNLANNNIQVLIDAENDNNFKKYNELSNILIDRYNFLKPQVIKTYQMYRKDSLDNLIYDINNFKYNRYLGVKMVRGAYWNSDKDTTNLFTSKFDTDANYNLGIMKLLENNAYSTNILATHNLESINFGYLLNKKNNMNIFEFGHLMGMRESKFNKLLDLNQTINTYIPYGPYKYMIPYLSRRLYENIDIIKHIL